MSPSDRRRVLEHVAAICASAEFVRSERMIGFLNFITESALNGRMQDLKERVIGHKVFGRPEDWDPTVDTIVRSEARRLRSKLESVYLRLGHPSGVRIVLPRGTYIPEFHLEPEPARSQRIEGETDASAGHPRRLLLMLCIGLMAVAVIGTAAIYVRRKADRSSLNHEGVVSLPFTSELGKEYSPAISPDEQTVAYVWDQDRDSPDIFLRSLDGRQTRRLPGAPGVRLFPAWSPDGRSIAYLRMERDEVAVIVQSLAGGAETTVTHIANTVGHWPGDESPLRGDPGPAWTQDGRKLIIADCSKADTTGGLFLVGLDGTRTRLTTTHGEDLDLYPVVSPNGEELAFARYSSHGRSDLYRMRLVPDALLTRSTNDQRAIRGIAWTRDGSNKLLYSSNRNGSFQLWTQALDGSAPQELMTPSSSASEPALSSRHPWLIYVESTENWNIWRAPIVGDHLGPAQSFLTSSGRNYDARYSPDGSKIAFVSDRSGSMQIWKADSDGGNPVQLTSLADSWLGGLAWSPDGTQIAFDWRPHEHSSIFVIPAAGGHPRQLGDSAYENRMPAWSPDGKTMYFSSVRDGAMAIWEIPAAGGAARRVSDAGMFAVAANSTGMYYSSPAGKIWRSGTHGEDAASEPEPMEASPVMSWFVLGKDLYFSQAEQGNKNSYQIVKRSEGVSRVLGTTTKPLVPNAPDITVSPDGKWLLFVQQDNSIADLKIRTTAPAKDSLAPR